MQTDFCHKYICLLIGILVLACLPVQAAKVYVADSTNSSWSAGWGGQPSDANSGSGWATAKASHDGANAIASAGDTILYSSGAWYNTSFQPIDGIGPTQRTVYACSSYVEANPEGGDYSFTHWYGSELVGGSWTSEGSGAYSNSSFSFTEGQDMWLWQTYNGDTDTVLTRCRTTTTCQSTDASFYFADNLIWVNPLDMGPGDDPANYDWHFSDNSIIIAGTIDYDVTGWDDMKYVTIWGIDMRWSCNDMVIAGGGPNGDAVSPNYFDITHCHLKGNIGNQGYNPALHHLGNYVDDAASYCDVVACSLAIGEAWQYNTYENYATDPALHDPMNFGNNGMGLAWFYNTYCHADSNIFYGQNWSKCAAMQKSSHTLASNSALANRWAFNTFEVATTCIYVFGQYRSDSIYGNVFLNNPDDCIRIMPTGTDFTGGNPWGPTVITNNTFINCAQPVRQVPYEGGGSIWAHDHEFKWNVVSNSQNASFEIEGLNPGGGQHFIIFDTNHIVTGGTESFSYAGTSVSRATWQTNGCDVNTTFDVSANLVDTTMAGGVDLTRTVGPEIVPAVIYGGRSWSIYGAAQVDTFFIATYATNVTTSQIDLASNFHFYATVVDSARLYFGTNKGSLPLVQTVSLPADPLSWTERTGLTDNTWHFWQIEAWADGGSISTSILDSAQTLSPPPANPPISILDAWQNITGTLQFSVSAGNNRELAFIATYEGNLPGDTIYPPSMNYGGQTMTRVAGIGLGSGYYDYLVVYVLNDAGITAATTNQFSMTWEGGTATSEWIGYAAGSYQNVNQANPIQDSAVAAIPSPGVTYNTVLSGLNVTTGGFAVSATCSGNEAASCTWNLGWTRQTQFGTGGGGGSLAIGDHAEGQTGTTTADVDASASDLYRLAHIAFTLNPTAVQGQATNPLAARRKMRTAQ